MLGWVIAVTTMVMFGSATSAAAQPAQEFAVSVHLLRAGSGEPLKDSSRAVVWLVPAVGSAHKVGGVEKHYKMVQHNKHFEPGLLVVPVGSSVDFPNLDPWFHNVFSLYRGKRFDLGLYQAGSTRSVRFDRVGASYLFCNIHPQMTAVILAVESEWFGVSGRDGRVVIRNVPPGTYRMEVWHEQASSQSLDALARTVVLPGGGANTVLLPVEEKSAAHKNKYGQDYDPDALTPSY